ncbi:MAG: hypothetical protein GF383_00525 [Candidatus Lokiarchaeota archaeon]|nr:hypothetical protein [Candidatus Lokiarchaeota archaeon]
MFENEFIHTFCPMGGCVINDDVDFWGVGIFREDGVQKGNKTVRVQPLDVLEMTLSGKWVDEPEHVQSCVRAVDR